MERCREHKKDMHIVFIDLEKAYDKVTRNVVMGLTEAQSFNKVHYPP
jgi:hypothetical protein